MRTNITIWSTLFKETLFWEGGCCAALEAAESRKNIWKQSDGRSFSEKRELYEIHTNYMVIAYASEEARIHDIETFTVLEGMSLSDIVPKREGTFEHAGKYCLIIHADARMGDTTNAMLYRNVIVNPDLYARTQRNTQKVQTIVNPAN